MYIKKHLERSMEEALSVTTSEKPSYLKKVVLKSKGHHRNIPLGCDDILMKQAKGMKLFVPKNCYRITQGKKV